MEKIRPVPTSDHRKENVFVHASLHNCSHVFLRNDAVRKPLQQPYTDPHTVIKRISDKIFIIKINEKCLTFQSTQALSQQPKQKRTHHLHQPHKRSPLQSYRQPPINRGRRYLQEVDERQKVG